MKLLFDQNLSFKLIDSVGTAFPNSKHVRDLGVTCTPDAEMWSYAQSNEVTSCQMVCGRGKVSNRCWSRNPRRGLMVFN